MTSSLFMLSIVACSICDWYFFSTLQQNTSWYVAVSIVKLFSYVVDVQKWEFDWFLRSCVYYSTMTWHCVLLRYWISHKRNWLVHYVTAAAKHMNLIWLATNCVYRSYSPDLATPVGHSLCGCDTCHSSYFSESSYFYYYYFFNGCRLKYNIGHYLVCMKIAWHVHQWCFDAQHEYKRRALW